MFKVIKLACVQLDKSYNHTVAKISLIICENAQNNFSFFSPGAGVSWVTCYGDWQPLTPIITQTRFFFFFILVKNMKYRMPRGYCFWATFTIIIYTMMKTQFVFFCMETRHYQHTSGHKYRIMNNCCHFLFSTQKWYRHTRNQRERNCPVKPHTLGAESHNVF